MAKRNPAVQRDVTAYLPKSGSLRRGKLSLSATLETALRSEIAVEIAADELVKLKIELQNANYICIP